MTKFFESESGNQLLDSLKTHYQKKKISFSPGKPFIFVCGGHRNRTDTFRHKFIEYSKSELDTFGFFLAEDAFNEIKDNGQFVFVNIAKFEEFIAELSDCVIIFPETPGSFAELGYFSNHEKIRKNMLIVNNFEEQGSSFLTIGPIELIDRHSNFKSTIFIKQSEEELDFSKVKDRLVERINIRKTNKTLAKMSFKELEVKDRVFAVLSVINILHPINYKNLIYVLINIFGNFDYHINLRQYLAILIHGGLVKKKEVEHQDFFWATDQGNSLIRYNFDDTKFKLGVMEYYGQLDHYELSEAIK